MNIRNKTMNLQETFGIPRFNDNMDLNAVINAVLSKFHPTKPEKSDITKKDFSVIDENNKPSVFMFEGGNILFSNIIFVNKEDNDNLQQAVFAIQTVTNSDSSGNCVKVEFLKIIGDSYFDVFNLCNIEAVQKFISSLEQKADNILDAFIQANLTIKGLQSIEINGVKLTSEMILHSILR